jgi:hypothetical protein
MAAKKNTIHATPRQTHNVRKRKVAQTEKPSTATCAPAGLAVRETGEMPTDPPVAVETRAVAADATAESSRIGPCMPAEESTTATADGSPEATAAVNQLCALDAAARVLGQTGQSMSCKDLITAMAANGYWQSPRGRTPAATLYAALLRELQTKGEQARFCKTSRGKFALRRMV